MASPLLYACFPHFSMHVSHFSMHAYAIYIGPFPGASSVIDSYALQCWSGHSFPPFWSAFWGLFRVSLLPRTFTMTICMQLLLLYMQSLISFIYIYSQRYFKKRSILKETLCFGFHNSSTTQIPRSYSELIRNGVSQW